MERHIETRNMKVGEAGTNSFTPDLFIKYLNEERL